jgi:hypothetical protein
MVAFFEGKTINHVDVEGNGESLYFALQEPKAEKDSVGVAVSPTLMGMNKIICSNMKINFKEGKVNNISFYIRPDASFIPPIELEEGDKKLRGFIWREKEKPEKKDVVKSKIEP